jgi:hypothetical protein
VIYKGILGKIPGFLWAKCGRPTTLHGRLAYPWALFDSVLSCCILLIERSTFILWKGKILRNRGVLSLYIPQSISFTPTSLPKLLFILPPATDPFNALSTTTAVKKIPPLKEASPTKVMSCALIPSTYQQKDLDAAKEVTRGAGAPSANMAGRLANSPGRPAMVCGQSVPHGEGQSPPACHCSPVPEVVECARLVLFPLVQQLGRSTDRSRLHIPLWGYSLQGR